MFTEGLVCKKDPEFAVDDNKTLSDTFEQVYYESLSLLQFRLRRLDVDRPVGFVFDINRAIPLW